MEAYRIFIVEDDIWYGEILAYQLAMNPDYEIHRFATAKECLGQLYLEPQLVTIDYSLPDMNGLALYKKIKQTHPHIPVVIISGQEDISTAISLLKEGIYDYLVKDENTKDLLWKTVIKARETQQLKAEVEQLQTELGRKYEFEKVIKGASPVLQKVFQMMEKAARTSINVTLSGETGTGKEMVAKAIHYHSERKKKPFVALNMSAIPKELIESELFGHEKGAFTGAISRKTGKFEEANHGTLFLDEIAELELSLQSKLLRVLQERELTRVGGNDKVKLDVRLIVATHQNLLQAVHEGRFREDLYYRIIGLPIVLPPLRERGSDVLLLSKFFLEEFAKDNKMKEPLLSPEAKDKLMQYSFPGNVRELKATLELAAVMCDGEEVKAADISFPTIRKDDFLMGEEQTLRTYTAQIIAHFLKKYDNNVVKVAEKLDIGKSTIYKMIQDKEIEL